MKRITKQFPSLFLYVIALVSCGGQSDSKEATSDSKKRLNKIEQAIQEASTPEALKNDPTANLPLNRKLASRITFGTPEEIDALIKKGASPDAKNRYGLPLIFMAAERGDIAILDHLVKAGADVNGKIGTTHNTDGMGYTGTADGTPMSYAAAKGKIEAMQFLLDKKADLNGSGPEGTTPLMSAARNLQLESVKWLIKNGSTAGKKKALGSVQMFINPDEKTQQIIKLLQ